MNDEQFNKARSKIVGVMLARVAALALAIIHVLKGDYLGALFLLAIGLGFGALYPTRDDIR